MRLAVFAIFALTISLSWGQCYTTGGNFVLGNLVAKNQAAGACPIGYKLAELFYQYPDTYPVAPMNFLNGCFGNQLVKLYIQSYQGSSLGVGIPLLLWVNPFLKAIYSVSPVDTTLTYRPLCEKGTGGTGPVGTPCQNPKTYDFEATWVGNGNVPSFTNVVRTNAYDPNNIFIWGASQITPGPYTSAGPKYVGVTNTNNFGIPSTPFITINKPANLATFNIDRFWITSPITQKVTIKLYHTNTITVDTIVLNNVDDTPNLINTANDGKFENLLKVELYHGGFPFAIDDIIFC
jgi:hypothetical protein